MALSLLRSSTSKIFSALLVGAILGYYAPSLLPLYTFLSETFIKLLGVIVGPLVLSFVASELSGIEMRGGTLTKAAIASVILFSVVPAVAIALGVVAGDIAVHLSDHGIGGDARLVGHRATFPSPFSPDVLVPSNVFRALEQGNLLHLTILGCVFAYAIRISGPAGTLVRDGLRACSRVLLRLTESLVKLAPVGALGAAACLVAHNDFAIARDLLVFAACVLTALAILALFVFSIILKAAQIPPISFVRCLREPVAIAFAAASSSAALPTLVAVLEKRGISKPVVGFVIPLAASFGMTGTPLFISAATVFLSFHLAIPLSSFTLFMLGGYIFAASKGVAIVPRGSIVVVTAILGSSGAEPAAVAATVGLLLGVDALLDMSRTAVNVLGYAVYASVVDRACNPLPCRDREES